MTKALDEQVGGDHYKGFKIQPVEYSTKNELGFVQGCIVKRITRYNVPGGKGLQDLQKIKHEVDLLIELEEWEEKLDLKIFSDKPEPPESWKEE